MTQVDAMLKEIREALKSENIDGWLLYNFRDSNVIATRILNLPTHVMCTRRYFYFIPANGEPRKLVHRIEESNLDSLPGDKRIYLSWRSLEEELALLLKDSRKIAMEYSPNCSIPYVSTVDAGTVELIRKAGVEVVSSANLIQYFEARWDEEQLNSHIEAANHLRQIVNLTFGFIREKIKSNIKITEYDVQQFMLTEFKERGLVTSSDPNCSVNANSANPHYEPTKELNTILKKGDYVLIDLWAKKNKLSSVFADITWMGYIGETVPNEFENIFQIVKGGRDAALNFVSTSITSKKTIRGYEVDDTARNYIAKHGYGEYFIHRTGHSIGEQVHGNGANLDNLETKDERMIIPQTCFSIEPGIYLRDRFGVRSEIDVYISENNEVIVTGLPKQEHVITILA